MIVTDVHRDDDGNIHGRVSGAPKQRTWTPERFQISVNHAGKIGRIAVRGGSHSKTWHLGIGETPPPGWVQTIITLATS